MKLSVARAKTWCEIKVADEWIAVRVDQALLRRIEPMRCSICKGQVMPRSKYITGSMPYLEHMQAHQGCSTRRGFSGIPTLHPNALL